MKTKTPVKRVIKNNNTYLQMKSAKGQTLNINEAYAIENNEVEGLLSLEVKQKSRSFTLTYNITGLDSLNTYLNSTSMDKSHFGFLLQNIYNVLQTLKVKNFHYNNLLLDFAKIKVEPSSKRLYFMYVPIIDYDNGTLLKDFLLEIIKKAQFVQGEDNSYVREYIQILNTGINFSEYQLEQYIKSLTGFRGPVMKKCPDCNNSVPGDANFCPRCQYDFVRQKSGLNQTAFYNGESGEIEPSRKRKKQEEFFGEKEYDPLQDKGETGEPDLPPSEDWNKSLVSGEAGATQVLNGGAVAQPIARLQRLSGGETKTISPGIVFSVGQNPDNTFAVPDNRAVSRHHAHIIEQNGNYYVKDLHSTNHTYLNGQRIQDNVLVPIYNGCELKFANEKFVFSIK